MNKKLGELALEAGILSQTQLQKLLEIQHKKRAEGASIEKTRLGQLLLLSRLVNPETLQSLLKQQLLRSASEASFSSENYSTFRQEPSMSSPTLFMANSPESSNATNQALFLSPIKDENFETTNASQKIINKETSPRYQVIKELGKGGMGVVQLAKDCLLGREVALKKVFLKNTKSLSEEQKALLWRLKQEVEITSILEHPNIVPLYDVDQSQGDLLQFTMRKIEGETLRDFFSRQKKSKKAPQESEILNIFLKICDAISYAHAQGVVHRDLKPENIMIGAFGEVYVMDWGIAKRIHEKREPSSESNFFSEARFLENVESSQTIGTWGTPGYMSPEQQEDSAKVTPQSDIYALGVILKECYTFCSPLEELYLKAQQNKEPFGAKRKRSLEENGSKKIPADILAIVQKANETQLKQRYLRVQFLVADILRYQNHQWVSVREFHLLDYLKKWFIRHKMVVVSLFVASFLVAFLTAYFQAKEQKNIENAYKQTILETMQHEKKAEQLQEDSAETKTEQMKLYIQALNQINNALKIKPHSLEAEKKKIQIATQILKLCYLTKNYELADYVAGEMKQIVSLSSLEKETIQKQVTEERNRILLEHQQSLKKWMAKFNSEMIFEEGELEDFIFEISQMKDEPIVLSLLEILQQGVAKTIKLEAFKSSEILLYPAIATIIGRIGNKKATSSLREMLQNIHKKIASLPKSQQRLEDLQLMSTIAIALGNLKDYESAAVIDDLRVFYSGEYFELKTRAVAKKIAQESVAYYEKALQKTPHNAEAYQRRGQGKLNLGDVDGAILDFNQAIQLNPENPENYSMRGLAKHNKKAYKEAISDFTLSLQKKTSTSAYNNRSATRYEIGDVEGAISDITKAIEMNPLPSFYTNRANMQERKGNYAEAIKDTTFAIKMDSKNVEAYIFRGVVKTKTGDYDGAHADYTEALRLNSQYFDVYNKRGVLKIIKGDWDGGIEDFSKSIQLNPKNQEAYFNRGVSKNQKNDFDGAISDFTESIKMDPTSETNYYYRGIAKSKKNDHVGAAEDCTEAIRLNPNLFPAYHLRGQMQFLLKNFSDALLDFNKAIQIHPRMEQFHFDRAELKNSQGDIIGAISDYSEEIKINPKFAKAYLHRGKAKLHLNRLEEALKDYQKFVQSSEEEALKKEAEKEIKEIEKLLQQKK